MKVRVVIFTGLHYTDLTLETTSKLKEFTIELMNRKYLEVNGTYYVFNDQGCKLVSVSEIKE
jgi:translation elongation factor P/translation initiation factor 5A